MRCCEQDQSRTLLVSSHLLGPEMLVHTRLTLSLLYPAPVARSPRLRAAVRGASGPRPPPAYSTGTADCIAPSAISAGTSVAGYRAPMAMREQRYVRP